MDVEKEKNKENLIYTLDKGVRFIPAKRCLIALNGSVIELSENSLRLLLLLLEGETDKSNLINQVWVEQRGSVSESSYYGQLYLLRKSFRQVGLPESLIKTIPRKGVKYVGFVTSEMFIESISQQTLSHPQDIPVESNELHSTILKNKNVLPSEVMHKSLKSTINDWYQSRSWHLFVSVLAVIAVCWLTTLFFAFIFLFGS